MIPIGTLCLIVRDHPLAGRTCTVLSDLRERVLIASDPTSPRRRAICYAIYVEGVSATPPASNIGALPHQLIPITPPAQAVDTGVPDVEPRWVIR